MLSQNLSEEGANLFEVYDIVMREEEGEQFRNNHINTRNKFIQNLFNMGEEGNLIPKKVKF